MHNVGISVYMCQYDCSRVYDASVYPLLVEQIADLKMSALTFRQVMYILTSYVVLRYSSYRIE